MDKTKFFALVYFCSTLLLGFSLIADALLFLNAISNEYPLMICRVLEVISLILSFGSLIVLSVLTFKKKN